MNEPPCLRGFSLSHRFCALPDFRQLAGNDTISRRIFCKVARRERCLSVEVSLMASALATGGLSGGWRRIPPRLRDKSKDEAAGYCSKEDCTSTDRERREPLIRSCPFVAGIVKPDLAISDVCPFKLESDRNFRSGAHLAWSSPRQLLVTGPLPPIVPDAQQDRAGAADSPSQRHIPSAPGEPWSDLFVGTPCAQPPYPQCLMVVLPTRRSPRESSRSPLDWVVHAKGWQPEATKPPTRLPSSQ